YAVHSLLQQTTDRTGKSFVYSIEFVFNADDTIGSLVFPPNSQAEGWYYFGAAALLITLAFLLTPSRRFASDEGSPASPFPVPTGYRSVTTKLLFVGWYGAITYITWGRDSWLFAFLWRYLPMFASLRVWGRFNIVLVPIIAWLVAVAYQAL